MEELAFIFRKKHEFFNFCLSYKLFVTLCFPSSATSIFHKASVYSSSGIERRSVCLFYYRSVTPVRAGVNEL